MSAFARLVAGVVLVAAAVVAPGCGPALESEVYHANYELVGQHLGARCEDCHDPGAALAAVDTACVSCHRGALDEHELVMGGLSHNAGHGCEECHTPEGWPVEQEHGFFPLTGSHDARLGPFGTLDYETEKCWTCHTTGDYTLELDATCTACHQDDLDAKEALQESPHNAGHGCEECHTNTRWSHVANAHGESPLLERFPLAVAHDASCVSCHDTGDYTVALDPTCETCHAEALARAEVREGGLHNPGRSCADCHEPVVWERDNEHDGPLLEELPLVWSHDLPCAECHSPPGDYTGLDAQDCAECHADDVERSEIREGGPHNPGKVCLECHGFVVWERDNEHDDRLREDFPLFAGHDQPCAECHSPPGEYTGLDANTCAPCHEPDRAAHKVAMGVDAHYDAWDCNLCHVSATWVWSGGDFDHTLGFVSECGSCHEPERPVDHWKGDCVDCHVPDTPDKWDDIDIDHSFFALTDAHDATTVACKDCHTSGTFKGLDSECQSCHESDRTTYKKDLGISSHFDSKDCGGCHEATAWSDAKVDHSFFALTDAHDTSDCEACHDSSGFTGLDPECASCHEGDRKSTDHYAGDDCGDCHTATKWSDAVVDHTFDNDKDGDPDFPLVDGHASVACSDCHGDGTYAGKSAVCEDCHASDRPTGHKVGAGCGMCHGITDWEDGEFDHGTSFPLAGAHADPVACTDCHTSGSFTSLTTTCKSCHETDRPTGHIVISGTGVDCKGCHPVLAKWASPSITHSSYTTFPQRHHTSTCSGCHTSSPDTRTFSCYASCHEHSKSDVDKDHKGKVSGYAYDFPKCLACHPKGKH